MTRTFEDLVALMERLRSPQGCPWDREQTYQTLRQYVIEEAYEVVDAIDRDDRDALREEIGDMLLQSVFLAQLSTEEGGFRIEDSITAIHDKLVRRHPHVFGEIEADTAEEVLTNWEKLKRTEREEKKESFFSSIPQPLPALLKAVRITGKAARVGFDWDRTEDVLAKLDEEIAEFREALRSDDREHVQSELGDILFTIANIARKLDLDAENALQETNRKFIHRFTWIEERLKEQGRTVEESTLEELDALWDEAKEGEG